MTDHERAEVCAKILALVSQGKSLRKACIEVESVSKSTFMDWLGADATLADQYARARGEGLQVKAEEICDPTDETPERGPDGKIDGGWVQNQRLKVDSRKWLVSKLLPKEYGDRIDMNHSGTVNVEMADALRKARERLAGQDQADG